MKYVLKNFMYFWLKKQNIAATDAWKSLPVYWKFQLAIQNLGERNKINLYYLLLTTPFGGKTFKQYAEGIGLREIPYMMERGDLREINRQLGWEKSGKHGNYYMWGAESRACNWICRLHSYAPALWGYISEALRANGFTYPQVDEWMGNIISAVYIEEPELDYEL